MITKIKKDKIVKTAKEDRKKRQNKLHKNMRRKSHRNPSVGESNNQYKTMVSFMSDLRTTRGAF